MRSRNTAAEGGAGRRSPAPESRHGPAPESGRGPAVPEGRGRTLPAVAVLAVAAALAGAASPASGQADGDLPSGLQERVERHRGFPAVPASALPGAGAEEVTAAGPHLEAIVDGEPLSATAGSPFVRLSGRVRQLPNAPYLRDGRLWLPVRLLAASGVGAERAATASRTGSAGRGARSGGPAGDGAESAGRDGAEDDGPWRVVIDPGHGGRDPGARGPRGTREKDVVLRIARSVRDRLDAKEDIEVSLTRDGDEFLPLERRSHLAVERGAHLFVSIHANSARRSGVRGFETYFLGEARTEESRRVAMRENAAIQYQEDSEWSPEEQVEYILTSADQRAYAQESNYLAGHIQNRMRRRHPGSDRGVKQAGFYVLMGSTASMPSVLVESGFLSNPSSERFLASDAGQGEIARSLADAVEAYFDERERRGGVRTASR